MKNCYGENPGSGRQDEFLTVEVDAAWRTLRHGKRRPGKMVDAGIFRRAIVLALVVSCLAAAYLAGGYRTNATIAEARPVEAQAPPMVAISDETPPHIEEGHCVYDEAPGREDVIDFADDFPSGTGAAGGGGRATSVVRVSSNYGHRTTLRSDGGSENLPVEGEVWKYSTLEPFTSRIRLDNSRDIKINNMIFNVKIDGFRARVLVDCFFRHGDGFDREGTFQVRLPDNASPFFLAFGNTSYFENNDFRNWIGGTLQNSALLRMEPDTILAARSKVWTELKPARMAVRADAREAYTTMVRRRVDPALLEWEGGGVFSIRIYPIVNEKWHCVTLGYDQDVAMTGSEATFRLPIPRGLGYCSVSMSMDRDQARNLKINERAGYYYNKEREISFVTNPVANELIFTYETGQNVALTGTDPAVGDFFVAKLTPDVPDVCEADGDGTALILLDTSAPAQPRDFNVWIKLLEETLAKNRGNIGRFAVLFYNRGAYWWRKAFVPNTPENTQRLLAAARQIYPGQRASRLAEAFEFANSSAWFRNEAGRGKIDVYLFGGLSVDDDPALVSLAYCRLGLKSGELRAVCPWFAGGKKPLQKFVRDQGGTIVSLARDDDIAEIARRIDCRPWQVTQIEIKGASDLLYENTFQTLFPGQSFKIFGRGKIDRQSVVRLILACGDDVKFVELPIDDVLKSDLAPRAFGQMAVAELELLGKGAFDFKQAYASHFYVPGQTCSLVMLETEADYRRFNLEKKDYSSFIRDRHVSEVAGNPYPAPDKNGRGKDAFLAHLWSITQWDDVPRDGRSDWLALRKVAAAMPDRLFADFSEVAAHRDVSPSLTLGGNGARSIVGDCVVAYSGRDAVGRIGDKIVEGLSGRSDRNFLFVNLPDKKVAPVLYTLPDTLGVKMSTPLELRNLAKILAELGKTELAMLYFELASISCVGAEREQLRKIVDIEYLNLLKTYRKDPPPFGLGEFIRTKIETLAARTGFDRADLLAVLDWHGGAPVSLDLGEAARGGGYVLSYSEDNSGCELYVLQRARRGTYGFALARSLNQKYDGGGAKFVVVKNWNTDRENRRTKFVSFDGTAYRKNVCSLLLQKVADSKYVD